MIVSRFLGIGADADQLRREFGSPGHPFTVPQLLRAAGSLGLRARCVRSRWDRLRVMALPALARTRDDGWIVLARTERESILAQDPAEPRPLVIARAQFEAIWTGEVLLLTRRSGSRSPAGRFGFAWFLPAIARYRWLFGEVLLASLALQVFALVSPLFFQVVIDKVLAHKGLTTLHVLAVGALALAVFEAVLGGLRAYLFSHTSSRVDVELGVQLFRHLLALPLAYFEARRVGDSVARVRELETIRQFMTGSSLTLVVDLAFTLVFVGVMCAYSPALTGLVLAALPVYVALAAVVTPVVRARLNDKFNRGADTQAFLVESVTGIHTVKALAVEPQMQRLWEEHLAGYVRSGFRALALINTAGQVAGLTQRVTTLAVVWAGAQLVMDGHLTVGQLVAFNMLSGRVSGPVLRVVQVWHEFQQAGISVARLGDVLNAPAEPHRQSGTSPARLHGRVTFEEVTFRYRPDGPAVLRGVTFEAAPGEVIGLVGRSGSGKSTVARLLQRLHPPERGRILVDGLDVALIDPAWLRRQIGVVLQESFLFDRSVRENIALADPGIPLDQVMRAAELAGAHEFIRELPDGYDARVGEHGLALSGGQRQRIAIARALVANPRLLIFDEATSALDYESESIVQRNLAQICRGRTVFLIAHRLSTLRPAHRVLVLDQGRLVEQGSHEALLRLSGHYARLHRLQSGDGVLAREGPG
jgi:subfamily B ATP-binding cassette protein HlyB/CyaB